MAKKLIITETMLNQIVAHQMIEEADLSKAQVSDAVKDALNNDKNVNKELEKKVKALVASCVNTLFRTLWQRRNFYEDEIKR
jgi:hypothetical protein